MIVGWLPRAGLQVVTPNLGPGTVVRVTDSGVLVRLENFGLDVSLAVDELRPAVEEQRARLHETAGNQTRTRRGAQTVAPGRSAVEALRFGLVPEQSLEELTLGFSAMSHWVVDQLPHSHGDQPRLAAISGPFGTGKSHAMAVVRYVAKRERYITARVEVDGDAVSLSKPEQLLYQLWRTTRAYDFESSSPWLDIFLRAIEGGHPPPRTTSREPDRVGQNYALIRHLHHHEPARLREHHAELNHVLSSSNELTVSEVARLLGGKKYTQEGALALERLVSHKVAERARTFVEVLLGYAAVARLAGYRGLIVTVDEFEVERSRLRRAALDLLHQVLCALVVYPQEQMPSRHSPLGVIFATVGEDSHDGDTLIDFMLQKTGGQQWELLPWCRQQLLELAARIHVLYCGAYGLDMAFESSIADRVEQNLQEYGGDDSGKIRAFIKRYVGLLDARYGPPGA